MKEQIKLGTEVGGMTITPLIYHVSPTYSYIGFHGEASSRNMSRILPQGSLALTSFLSAPQACQREVSIQL